MHYFRQNMEYISITICARKYNNTDFFHRRVCYYLSSYGYLMCTLTAQTSVAPVPSARRLSERVKIQTILYIGINSSTTPLGFWNITAEKVRLSTFRGRRCDCYNTFAYDRIIEPQFIAYFQNHFFGLFFSSRPNQYIYGL